MPLRLSWLTNARECIHVIIYNATYCCATHLSLVFRMQVINGQSAQHPFTREALNAKPEQIPWSSYPNSQA